MASHVLAQFQVRPLSLKHADGSPTFHNSIKDVLWYYYTTSFSVVDIVKGASYVLAMRITKKTITPYFRMGRFKHAAVTAALKEICAWWHELGEAVRYAQS